ncbi:MAG: outer membrane protein assembly factor BamE [Cypionkella sp.]|nr:outer membrane protein assembly factor BamE [Cypionkella sp.]MDZ4312395.1 outer membrane protein assembly factor BamE [Cypionkella sp.]MDZ4393423.1 outer membrane protein assembly factor BamE [Cypionkella sp.]
MIAAAMVLITACSPIYRDHGYIPTEEELALLSVGEDTRESVAVKVGRPSASGLLNDVGWYYVESRFKTTGALPPKEIDREVVAITFTEAGVVENIERFGLEKGQIVPLSRRVTTSNVKGASLLQQLFGNIGGLSAEQLLR